MNATCCKKRSTKGGKDRKLWVTITKKMHGKSKEEPSKAKKNERPPCIIQIAMGEKDKWR